MDRIGDRRVTSFFAEDLPIDPDVFFMLKKGFRYQETSLRTAVQQTGKPEVIVTGTFQNLGPLAGFQRDPVGSRKAGGYKSYIFGQSPLGKDYKYNELDVKQAIRSPG